MTPDNWPGDLPAWIEPAWQRLGEARGQGRLPHALLLIGAEGVGKHTLATHLASALLCGARRPDGTACGQCSACGWLRAGTHPDLLELRPEEAGKAIKVDQVRALCSELGMTSHAGHHKVAIISPADAMNTNAANSLLKTLEEPTDNTLLVLLTALPGKLPATIRSRCQQLRVPLPRRAVAQRWLETQGVAAAAAGHCLQMAAGAPLKALLLAHSELGELREQRLDELCRVWSGQLDPVKLAAQWTGAHEADALQWWLGWLRDIVRWRVAQRPPAETSAAGKLQKISESVDSGQVYRLADAIHGALSSIGSGLNRQLILEDLLISWADTAPGSSRAGNR
jgi:DNA polymerase-3 subunit delta'